MILLVEFCENRCFFEKTVDKILDEIYKCIVIVDCRQSEKEIGFKTTKQERNAICHDERSKI